MSRWSIRELSSRAGESGAHGQRRKKRAAEALLFLVLLAAGAMLCGRYPVTPAQMAAVLFKGQEADPSVRRVLLHVRLPRICFALAAGGGLASAGAALQGVCSNPLATPDTLGVANGASFGAALGILLGMNGLGIQAAAMVCGICAVLLVFLISRKKEGNRILMLVLSGMVVSSFFSALLSLVKYVADPQDVLPNITYWLMGSLNGITWRSVEIGLPWICAGTAVIWLLRWRLNALSLSEDEAKSLGLRVGLLRGILIGASSAVTAAVVAACGQIGWIGLVVPHCCRLVLGTDYQKTVGPAICFGAAFLLIADTAARSMTAAEIPAAILTALAGAPVFLILIRREGDLSL